LIGLNFYISDFVAVSSCLFSSLAFSFYNADFDFGDSTFFFEKQKHILFTYMLQLILVLYNNNKFFEIIKN